MISPVTNLTISSQNSNSITFQFDEVTDPLIGGYWLWKSLDKGITYTQVDFQIDSIITNTSGGTQTTNRDGYTYFSYQLETTDYGRELYFYITAVSQLWEISILSNVVETFTTPNPPTNLIAAFNNYVCNLSWDAPFTSTGLNTDISNYAVYRGTFISLGNGTLDANNTISNPLLTVGDTYIIFDNLKKNMWYGTVANTDGTVQLSSTNQYKIADTSTDYTVTDKSITIYIYSSDLQIIGYTLDTIFVDNTITKNNIYYYAVAAIGYTNNYSSMIYCPVFTPSLNGIVPYLRYVGNSTNALLNNRYWRILKNILIDKNYYNKNQFAIPYIANETYNFKGYLGVYNCNLDVFLNNTYYLTVVTDVYGNFEFNISLQKGDNLIQLQARDYQNITFSNKSSNYKITTVNIYTFFSGLGIEYENIWTEIYNQQQDHDFVNGRSESVENQVSPLVGIYRDISEADADYRQILLAVYNSYIYVGFKEALNMVFEVIKQYTAEIDDYEIYYNNEFYDTMECNVFPITSGAQISSTGLIRQKYWYAVTSTNEIGEETDPSIVPCDDRWWPITSTGYRGYNTLMWNEANGVDLYNIYRCDIDEYSSVNDFYFLRTIPSNLFVDNGMTSTGSKNPPPYNINNFNKPSNLRILNNKLSNRFMALRKRSWMNIFLYSVNDLEIPDYQLNRISMLCADLIPQEIGYDIIIARDSAVSSINTLQVNIVTIKLLNVMGTLSAGIFLDIDGLYNNFDTAIYGLIKYGSSYYDSGTYNYCIAMYESIVYYNPFTVNQTYTWESHANALKIYYRRYSSYTSSNYTNYSVGNYTLLSSGQGSFSLTLLPGEEVQFRFLFEESSWNTTDYFILKSVG